MSHPLVPEEAVIVELFQENRDTTTFTLQLTDEQKRKGYYFYPGQFNMLSIFGVGEAPISISSDSAHPETFAHTIRHVGSLTKMFSRLSKGSLVGIRGPYGNGWPLELAQGKNLLIVAGGIGLAPLRPVIYNVLNHRDNFGRVELLYGAKNEGELLFRRYFPFWSESLDVMLTVDEAGIGWQHQAGAVTSLFPKMNSTPADTVVMTCGPEIMMKYVVQGLLEQGFDPQQIFVSLERKMHCGIRKCGRCQVGYKFVCYDGPVFSYAAISDVPAEIIGVLGGVAR